MDEWMTGWGKEGVKEGERDYIKLFKNVERERGRWKV